MRIIITGASGFIGRELVRQLIDDGHYVLAMGRKFSVKPLSINLSYVETDLSQYDGFAIDQILQLLPDQTADIFIHAAGQAHVLQNENTKNLFVSNNITASDHALKIAKAASVRNFIYISTVAVSNEDVSDIYAYTKKESEKIVKIFCANNNMTYTIIRPVAVYGEKDVKGNVYKMICQIYKGFFPLINGGTTIKNILYVRNLSWTISYMITNDMFPINTAIVIRDRDQLTIKELYTVIHDELGGRCILIPVNKAMIGILCRLVELVQKVGLLKKMNVNSIKKLTIDSNFAFSPYGFMPYSSFQGLKNTVRWFKDSLNDRE